MTLPPEPSCRVYAILARDGRSAVVFRRGPTKHVLVLRWWLDDDRLEVGQWLKGRIYERRCDVSPDGDLLVYFAAKWGTQMQTWTAVSRAPYLTALVLWPKGDAWGGGGVFDDQKTIALNQGKIDDAIVPGVKPQNWHPLGPEPRPGVPSAYTVRRWSEHAGRGEDNPMLHHRTVRDGWIFIAEGDSGPYRYADYAWYFNAPEIYERPSPTAPLVLRRYLNAICQRNGPWYVEDFEVCSKSDGRTLRMFKTCSWADWQANGDLLFALDGCLYRLPAEAAADVAVDPRDGAVRVADLAPLRFQETRAPDWALTWP